MRRTIGAILIGAAALAMPAGVAFAQTQVSLPAIAESHLVVEAYASVEVPADEAVIVFEVSVRADSLDVAKNRHLELVGTVTGAIEAAGVPGDRISSSGYRTERESTWKEDGTEVFLGYSARCAIEVRISDFELGPRVVDAAISGGASEVSSLRFETTRRAEAREQAIRKATEAARRNADVLASASGVVLGRLRGTFLDPAAYQDELGLPRAARDQSEGRGPMFGQSVFRDSEDFRRGARVVFEPEPVTVYATVRLVYETKPNE